jgi:hypothetical protein
MQYEITAESFIGQQKRRERESLSPAKREKQRHQDYRAAFAEQGSLPLTHALELFFGKLGLSSGEVEQLTKFISGGFRKESKKVTRPEEGSSFEFSKDPEEHYRQLQEIKKILPLVIANFTNLQLVLGDLLTQRDVSVIAREHTEETHHDLAKGKLKVGVTRMNTQTNITQLAAEHPRLTTLGYDNQSPILGREMDFAKLIHAKYVLPLLMLFNMAFANMGNMDNGATVDQVITSLASLDDLLEMSPNQIEYLQSVFEALEKFGNVNVINNLFLEMQQDSLIPTHNALATDIPENAQYFTFGVRNGQTILEEPATASLGIEGIRAGYMYEFVDQNKIHAFMLDTNLDYELWGNTVYININGVHRVFKVMTDNPNKTQSQNMLLRELNQIDLEANADELLLESHLVYGFNQDASQYPDANFRRLLQSGRAEIRLVSQEDVLQWSTFESKWGSRIVDANGYVSLAGNDRGVDFVLVLITTEDGQNLLAVPNNFKAVQELVQNAQKTSFDHHAARNPRPEVLASRLTGERYSNGLSLEVSDELIGFLASQLNIDLSTSPEARFALNSLNLTAVVDANGERTGFEFTIDRLLPAGYETDPAFTPELRNQLLGLVELINQQLDLLAEQNPELFEGLTGNGPLVQVIIGGQASQNGSNLVQIGFRRVEWSGGQFVATHLAALAQNRAIVVPIDRSRNQMEQLATIGQLGLAEKLGLPADAVIVGTIDSRTFETLSFTVALAGHENEIYVLDTTLAGDILRTVDASTGVTVVRVPTAQRPSPEVAFAPAETFEQLPPTPGPTAMPQAVAAMEAPRTTQVYPVETQQPLRPGPDVVPYIATVEEALATPEIWTGFPADGAERVSQYGKLVVYTSPENTQFVLNKDGSDRLGWTQLSLVGNWPEVSEARAVTEAFDALQAAYPDLDLTLNFDDRGAYFVIGFDAEGKAITFAEEGDGEFVLTAEGEAVVNPVVEAENPNEAGSSSENVTAMTLTVNAPIFDAAGTFVSFQDVEITVNPEQRMYGENGEPIPFGILENYQPDETVQYWIDNTTYDGQHPQVIAVSGIFYPGQKGDSYVIAIPSSTNPSGWQNVIARSDGTFYAGEIDSNLRVTTDRNTTFDRSTQIGQVLRLHDGHTIEEGDQVIVLVQTQQNDAFVESGVRWSDNRQPEKALRDASGNIVVIAFATLYNMPN